EEPRLAKRAYDAVFGDAGGGRVLRVQAEAREQVDRAVAAEEISPPDLEEYSRREVELVARRTARRRAGHEPPLEPAAHAEGRRGRFVDCHEQVARRFVTVPEFADPDAAEQTEAGQAALAVVDRSQAERPPRLH